jgi:hypothetical protein
MRITGDIKVWLDSDKACARLEVDDPEGPLVLHASTPLEPIRRMVARQLERRGMSVSGDDTSFTATVKRIARRRAVKRLQKMAPSAFKPGAIGPFVARQQLRKRKLVRQALAQAGRPVGSKALGPIPPGRELRRRRGGMVRRLQTLPKAATVRRALPAPGGGAGAPAAPPPPGPSPADDSDPRALAPVEPLEAEGQGGGEEAQSEDAPGEGEGAADEAAVDEGDGAEAEGGDAMRDEEGGEGMSGDEEESLLAARRRLLLRRRMAERLRMRAALGLLTAAERSPAARQKVRTIVALAGEGDPKAAKALKTLKKASVVKKQATQKKQAATAPATASRALVPVSKPVLPAPPPARPLPPVPVATRPAEPEEAKWWDILAPWRRGIG